MNYERLSTPKNAGRYSYDGRKYLFDEAEKENSSITSFESSSSELSIKLSNAKNDEEKGALIKNTAIELMTPKIGAERAVGLFGGLNNQTIARNYDGLKESYDISRMQGVYIPANRKNNPKYLSLVAMSQTSREQNNREAEKLSMQRAQEVTETPKPEKQNVSEKIEKNEIPIDAFERFKKSSPLADMNWTKDYMGVSENIDFINSIYKDYNATISQRASQEIPEQTRNSSVSIIADISNEKTESGLPVEEFVWLVDDLMSYNIAVLDGDETRSWEDLPVGYSLNLKKEDENKVEELTEYEIKTLESLAYWEKQSRDKQDGLDMAVYSKVIDGKQHIVVVNAGSEFNLMNKNRAYETAYDWSDNLLHLFAETNDTKKSISFAKKIVEKYPDANITFVGFSKGGAEAAANAVATGKDAVLFNPASPNLSKYDLDFDDYKANMVSYIIDDEFLSETVGKIWKVPGDKKIIKEAFSWKKFLCDYAFGSISLILRVVNSFNLHKLSNFIKE